MSVEGTISTHERGVDHVVEWQFLHFSTLGAWLNAMFYSPVFSFGGERWCLGISPIAWSGGVFSKHVELYLWKYSSGRSIKQPFSVSLKTAIGNKYNEQHCTKDFGDSNLFHCFKRFMPTAELTRRKSELLPDDVLTVICTMKKSTSSGSESNAGSAENCSSDSDTNKSSPDSESVECCHKCPNCSAIVKKQKKLLEELENQKERSEGAQSLCEDYQKMLMDGRHHDLILKVGDKELRAHRDVLRARSRVFESMLDHDMKEKNTGVIDVPDCDPGAMELFLSYVYCGKIEALDHSNMLGLYYVADKYEMIELKRKCSDFLKKSLSVNNICSAIQLALSHSDSDLLDCATRYFEDNVLDVLQTVEWQSFLKENSTVGNELFIKSIKKLKNVQT